MRSEVVATKIRNFAHKDWLPLVGVLETSPAFKEVCSTIIGDPEHTPSNIEAIFSIMKFPIGKIIIVGQDTYPQDGIATGRAFEVGGLTSWNSPFKQASLRNIVRCIYKSYTGSELGFNEIRSKILDREFRMISPASLWDIWSEDGVTALNMGLTCEIGAPGSDLEAWKPVMKDVFAFIEKTKPTYFVWGVETLSLFNDIVAVDDARIIFAHHPSRCTGVSEDDFLTFTGFKKFPYIRWNGIMPLADYIPFKQATLFDMVAEERN